MTVSAKERNIRYHNIPWWHRIFCLHLLGGDEEMTPSQRFLAIIGQILSFLVALQCYFVGAGSMVMFLIAIFGLATGPAFLLGFLLPFAFASAFVNWRLNVLDVSQALLHLMGSAKKVFHPAESLTNLVDENKNVIGKMSNGRKFALFVGFLCCLAAGMVVAGVTYAFFIDLALLLTPALAALLYPVALILVVSCLFSITLLLFNSVHTLISQASFTPSGIAKRIYHYFTEGLEEEIRQRILRNRPELAGDPKKVRSLVRLQYWLTLFLSLVLVGLIISGVVMTIFSASRPGIAEFFANLSGTMVPTAAEVLASWIISCFAFVGEFGFYLRMALETAKSFCSFLFDPGAKELHPGEVNFYQAGRFSNAFINALIGVKEVFDNIVNHVAMSVGFIAFAMFSFAGGLFGSAGAGENGKETNVCLVFEKSESQAPKIYMPLTEPSQLPALPEIPEVAVDNRAILEICQKFEAYRKAEKQQKQVKPAKRCAQMAQEEMSSVYVPSAALVI